MYEGEKEKIDCHGAETMYWTTISKLVIIFNKIEKPG